MVIVKRLGVTLAGHARVSRLITEDSKVRATTKDDRQEKCIVNVLWQRVQGQVNKLKGLRYCIGVEGNIMPNGVI